MKTYIFKVPDEYDIKSSFKMFDGDAIIFDRPVDHGVFERVTSNVIPIEEDSYWGKINNRISVCVDKLMDYAKMPYIVDPCGTIHALEIVTDQITK